jgi:hypothetical protein
LCVCDGRSISLWFDNRHPLGPLVEFFGYSIITDSDLGRDERLSSIIASKEWIWPPYRSPEWIDLIGCTLPSFLLDDGRSDLVCWKDAPKGTLPIRCVWNSIHLVQDKVEWWNLVWYKHAILRFSFILWIVIHDTLST